MTVAGPLPCLQPRHNPAQRPYRPPPRSPPGASQPHCIPPPPPALLPSLQPNPRSWCWYGVGGGFWLCPPPSPTHTPHCLCPPALSVCLSVCPLSIDVTCSPRLRDGALGVRRRWGHPTRRGDLCVPPPWDQVGVPIPIALQDTYEGGGSPLCPHNLGVPHPPNAHGMMREWERGGHRVKGRVCVWGGYVCLDVGRGLQVRHRIAAKAGIKARGGGCGREMGMGGIWGGGKGGAWGG